MVCNTGKKEHFSRAVLAALLLVLAVFQVSTAVVAAAPNFIIMIGDDVAWNDHGCYGHPHVQTPHTDRLAREGMRFDAAFLSISSCSPSRCSIMTGRYPHSTGAGELHQPLPANQVVFPALLKKRGYYTAAAGKWHLGNAPRVAFDRIEAETAETLLACCHINLDDEAQFSSSWLAISTTALYAGEGYPLTSQHSIEECKIHAQRCWPLQKNLRLTMTNRPTIGQLELRAGQEVLACWKFSAGITSDVERLKGCFETAHDNLFLSEKSLREQQKSSKFSASGGGTLQTGYKYIGFAL